MRCVRCGKELSVARCSGCGFELGTSSVVFLCSPDVKMLQLSSSVLAAGVSESDVDTNTQFATGRRYFQAYDYDQAHYWLQTPAKKGIKEAQFLLGQVYEISKPHQDPSKAIFWYEQSAARGDVNAMNALIRLYGKGEYSNRDKLQYWKEKLNRNVKEQLAQKYGNGAAKSTNQTRIQSSAREDAKHFVIRGGVLEKYTGTSPNPIIPQGITAIADNAFCENEHIQSVVIPHGVRKIGDGAFFECSKLTEVVFPETLTEIGGGAFGETAIKEIKLPASLISLGDEGVFGGTELEKVVVPGSVEIIPYGAFSWCWHLTEVVLEHGVRVIEDEAFEQCKNLHTIVIPDTIEVIGGNKPHYDGCFRNCDNLKVVKASDAWKRAHPDLLNRIIPNSDESQNYEIQGTMLIRYRGKSASPIIPNHIIEIGANAFKDNSNIIEMNLSANVIKIGDSAFSGCKKLKKIGMPNVSSIGRQAFYGCDSLEHVSLPYSLRVIPTGLFEWCNHLSEIIIPDSIEVIGGHAFSCCRNLKKVVIGKSVTEIGDRAFSSCESLSLLVIPDSLKRIGTKPRDTAFDGCNSLNEVCASERWKKTYPELLRKIIPSENESFNFDISGTKLIRYWGRKENPTIPPSVTEIGEFAFYTNSFVRRISIPYGVTRIGRCAFGFCKNLERLILTNNLRYIGDSCFSYCEKLQQVNIPAGLNELPESAFSHCNALSKVDIPGSILTIGRDAFTFCTQIKTVSIRSGVQRIDHNAFHYCRELEEVSIPDSVAFVDLTAFEDCKELRKLHASAMWKNNHSEFMRTLPAAAQK